MVQVRAGRRSLEVGAREHSSVPLRAMGCEKSGGGSLVCCQPKHPPREVTLSRKTNPNLYRVVAADVNGDLGAYLPNESKKRTQNT